MRLEPPAWSTGLARPVKALWERLRPLPTPVDPPGDGVERRGQPPRWRPLANLDAMQALLCAAIEGQEAAARLKADASWRWGRVGWLELAAAAQARQVVMQVCAAARATPEQDSAALAQRCHEALTALAAHWRANPDDTDGYGLGTVYAIRRVLQA